jgi:hypothetical protein
MRWRKSGVLTACKGTQIETVPALVELAEHYRQLAEAKASDPLAAEKVRKLKLANDETEGQVVRWSDLEPLLARLNDLVTSTLVRRFVRELPVRIASLPVPGVRELSKAEVTALVEELRKEIEAWK